MPTTGGVADLGVELLGLTAVLRARPTGASKVVALYLSSVDPRVRADAANTLARLRAKDGTEQLRKLLVSDANAVVRANAARALGAAVRRHAAHEAISEPVRLPLGVGPQHVMAELVVDGVDPLPLGVVLAAALPVLRVDEVDRPVLVRPTGRLPPVEVLVPGQPRPRLLR